VVVVWWWSATFRGATGQAYLYVLQYMDSQELVWLVFQKNVLFNTKNEVTKCKN
jgi:hypothetical protein